MDRARRLDEGFALARILTFVPRAANGRVEPKRPIPASRAIVGNKRRPPDAAPGLHTRTWRLTSDTRIAKLEWDCQERWRCRPSTNALLTSPKVVLSKVRREGRSFAITERRHCLCRRPMIGRLPQPYCEVVPTKSSPVRPAALYALSKLSVQKTCAVSRSRHRVCGGVKPGSNTH